MPFSHLVVSKPSDPVLSRRLARGVTERTTRLLRKSAEDAAVVVSFVAPEHWVVGSRSLAELGLASFWLDTKVTAGTNSAQEKAAYLAEIFAFMRETLGSLHEESYALVHEVPADAYAVGGVPRPAPPS